jgi:hypothetical protein
MAVGRPWLRRTVTHRAPPQISKSRRGCSAQRVIEHGAVRRMALLAPDQLCDPAHRNAPALLEIRVTFCRAQHPLDVKLYHQARAVR